MTCLRERVFSRMCSTYRKELEQQRHGTATGVLRLLTQENVERLRLYYGCQAHREKKKEINKWIAQTRPEPWQAVSVPCYCLKVLACTQLVRAGMTQGFGIWKADLDPLKEDFAPYVPGPTPCMAYGYFSFGRKLFTRALSQQS